MLCVLCGGKWVVVMIVCVCLVLLIIGISSVWKLRFRYCLIVIGLFSGMWVIGWMGKGVIVCNCVSSVCMVLGVCLLLNSS